MTIDLANGLAVEKDLVFPSQPDHPEMRESVSIWMFEENGAFAFPRMGIEAEAQSWNNRRYDANFSLGNGRVLHQSSYGPAPSAIDANGRPAILGAGALTFQCLEPFKRWRVTYDGPARDGHITEQIDGSFKTKNHFTQLRMDAEMTMVTPAWIQEVSADLENMSKEEAANAQAMGMGYRFEHHFRAQGTLTIDGNKRDFKATGTRIHRQSIRRLEGFFGHCWLSAVFPDGRAFGCLAYPPHEEGGEYSYNDAAIFYAGKLIPAKVIKAPFLRCIVSHGDDVSVILESELGRTRIKGVTAHATFRVGIHDIGNLKLSIQQGGALFSWDDQQAYGMVERSSHTDMTTLG